MDNLAERERVKYEKVWADPSYRVVSPGMMEVDQAYRDMGCAPDMSINDYGSGTGRATKWFQDRGMRALGVDHADNACETPVLVYRASLWDMRGVPPADFGFCCDVMEHIPPEKVDAVLAEIYRLTRRAAWFRIATRPDVMGPKLLGEPLHLTIRDAVWWSEKMWEVWEHVDIIRDHGQDVVMHCWK